ncbi:ABC transporter ATP-binding protein [Micromonospora sp. CA-263727]|uniref:ABC transporter ATP-binding protein n=1 Tax=Micromonospora sp. CA-263727 TaxID=3239967 RepID=UPI003D8C8842
MLVAEDVEHSFGSTVALAGVSATVEAGEAVALVGPSGSGKTTFMYCLSGLLRPAGGRVTFRGQDLARLGEEERSALRLRSFGFVFQSAELVPELALRENIALPLELLRVRSSQRRARVDELLERLSLVAAADRRPARVSGGQAQRAAVARAVVHGPDLIFADEPTGALDSANGEAVVSLLWELSREGSTAIVLVTHDRELAGRANRTITLRDGSVVGDPLGAGWPG